MIAVDPSADRHGPGDYAGAEDSVIAHTPSATFGTAKRDSKTQDSVGPGPGFLVRSLPLLVRSSAWHDWDCGFVVFTGPRVITANEQGDTLWHLRS